jgi:hypothetical protein
MVSQMRIVSSPKVVDDAHKVVRLIMETYCAPNKAFAELENAMESHTLDPLRCFSEACREEMHQLGAF